MNGTGEIAQWAITISVSMRVRVLVPDNKGQKPGMAVHDAYNGNIGEQRQVDPKSLLFNHPIWNRKF